MNRSHLFRRMCIWLFLSSLSPLCHSFDLHVGGFGTASVSCFSSNEADYISNDQPKGPGVTQTCDTGLDSVIGAQFDALMTPSLEAGLQIVADRNADESYDPDVTVAQLRWFATDRLTFRLGRMPSPTFLHSEDRQVRYAMPWVRPPLEVYGMIPTLYNDGGEFIYVSHWNGWQMEWQSGISKFDFDIPELITKGALARVETKNLYTNLLIRNSNTLVKLGYVKFKVTAPSTSTDALFAGLRAVAGPAGAALADDLEIEDSDSQLISIGIRHETQRWLAMSEFAYREIDSYLRDQYGFYATLGYRIDRWMPYATVARRWSKGPNTDSRAGPLTTEVNNLLAYKFDSSSWSLGLSRELSDQSMLKMQLDHIQPDDGSRGLLINQTAAYDLAHPDSDWLFTLSIDFIF